MKVNLHYDNNLNFKGKARDFEDIIIDEPESFHGNDLGPSPIEYFLIGIGSCLASTLTYCFLKKGISLNNLDVEVDGIIKHIPPKMHLRLIEINIDFHISLKEDPPKESIEYCLLEFKKYCPIHEPITKGIPINMNFIENKK